VPRPSRAPAAAVAGPLGTGAGLCCYKLRTSRRPPGRWPCRLPVPRTTSVAARAGIRIRAPKALRARRRR